MMNLQSVLVLFAASAACSQAPAPVGSGIVNSSKGTAMTQSPQRPIANLPFSQGRSFASLDEYLDFLETRGAYGVPWYRQIRPGVYELVSRRGPGAEPQTFSREELAREFGFQA